MNELNSIPAISKVNHYADLKSNTVKSSSLHSIPASSLYKHSGMSALGNYNQASVSFEGFGFFQKGSVKPGVSGIGKGSLGILSGFAKVF